MTVWLGEERLLNSEFVRAGRIEGKPLSIVRVIGCVICCYCAVREVLLYLEVSSTTLGNPSIIEIS